MNHFLSLPHKWNPPHISCKVKSNEDLLSQATYHLWKASAHIFIHCFFHSISEGLWTVLSCCNLHLHLLNYVTAYKLLFHLIVISMNHQETTKTHRLQMCFHPLLTLRFPTLSSLAWSWKLWLSLCWVNPCSTEGVRKTQGDTRRAERRENNQ